MIRARRAAMLLRIGQRQDQAEARVPGATAYLEPSVEELGQTVRVPEPEPGPLARILGREEGIEDPIQMLGSDARAVVRHLEHHAAHALEARASGAPGSPGVAPEGQGGHTGAQLDARVLGAAQ